MHTEASPGWGGQEIRIMEEMRWFRQRGHDLMLIAPSHSKLVEHAGSEGFKLDHLAFTKNKLASEIWRMFGLIGKFKPHVLATHSSVDSWAALIAGKLRGVPCRVRYRHVSTPIKGHFLNRWQYRSLCNLVLTTGECIRKPLIQTFSIPRDKVVSAPTAVRPPEVILSKSEARSNLKAELNLGSEARFLGQVSVLRSWKGHFVLIDAFAQIAQEFPDFHLVLVGSGPIEKRIAQELKHHPLKDRIHLVGHKSNPWPYFRALEVAVLASLSNEGIPQSLLQAMYAEIPVVGTDVGGIPEILFHGKTGLLVKPGDATSMSQALKRILDDESLRTNLCSTSLELVQTAFKWDNLGTKLEALFCKCLKPRHRTLDPDDGSSLNQFNQTLYFNLGVKRKVLLFTQHSSWGAASNFNEMFNASGKYDSWEILHDHGGLRGYQFGDRMKQRKVLFNNNLKIKDLVKDPDSIIFIFDYNGLKLFKKCMRNIKEKFRGRAMNVFWSGNPYIKHHKACNKWASKFDVRAFAMLDLLRFSKDAIPLMQPYDLSRMSKLSNFNKPEDRKKDFVICHSPGHKGGGNEKGTQMIKAVVTEIQQEHHSVSYKQLGEETWLSHEDCVREKANADVFIDKIGIHSAGGIGKSGIEAICLGIPTICSTHKSILKGRYEQLNIINGDTQQELKQQLSRLIKDQKYLKEMKENATSNADVFDYTTTLEYLDQTMSR